MARSVCLPWQRFSIPHSSVIFSTVTSGNPPCKEALSPQPLLLSFFLATSPLFSLFLSFHQFFFIIYSTLFSYLNMGNHLSFPNPNLIPSLKVSPQQSSISSDKRSPNESPFSALQVLADILLLSLKIHNPSQCPGQSVYHSDAYFYFIRNSWIHRTATGWKEIFLHYPPSFLPSLFLKTFIPAT